MATQERTLASELVHLGAGVFGQIARTAPVLPREHRDSLGAIEVEVVPVGAPPRFRTVWTMAALSALAMAFTFVVHAKKAPTAEQAPRAVSADAPLVAPVTVSRASPPL
jgi:hypothetical protein